MNPADYAKAGTEHAHQTALFMWASVASEHGPNVADDWASGMGLEAAKSSRTNDKSLSQLKLMFAIPNGGKRDAITANRLKAEGVKAGVPDIFLPVPRNNWHGLFIELKRPKSEGKTKGAVGKDQSSWLDNLHNEGYGVTTCYGWEEAKDILVRYLTY